VDRQAPEAIATAVTATCVMAEETALWTDAALAAAAITLSEVRTGVRDVGTAIWSSKQQNLKRLGLKDRNLRRNGDLF